MNQIREGIRKRETKEELRWWSKGDSKKEVEKEGRSV